MAEEFSFWLERKLYAELGEEQKNASVLVVSLIGKDVADNTKADLLNGYLGKTVFLDRWKYQEPDRNAESEVEIFIEVYFDPDELVLWLLLKGANDAETIQMLFTQKLYKGMSFFEKLAAIEQQQLHYLALMFQISHALIILDQGCRFDLDWINTFKQLNRLRPRLSRNIRQKLSSFSESELAKQFPTSMIDNGRIAASPRLFFCFYRNPLRPDLNPLKKKELLEKMEKCLENQISNLLKQHGLLDNRFPESAFAQITISSGAPFVYCFNQSEIPIDQTHELAMALFDPSSQQNMTNSEDGNTSIGGMSGRTSDSGFGMNGDEIQRIIADIIEPKPIDKEKLDPSEYNFHYFLHKALNNMRKGGENASKFNGKKSAHRKQQPMDLLTIYQFVETAKIVIKAVEEEWEQGEMTPKATPELRTIESLIESAIQSAIAIYTRQLALQPEVTGGGDLVFSNLEHEYSLKMALDYLNQCCPRAAGISRLEEMAEQLKTNCKNVWLDGHQRCEQRSLTGQLCHFKIGHDENESISRERSGSRGRSSSSRKYRQKGRRQENVCQQIREHCSGVKTFSMCNCGLSRQIRIDPFSLKEANFDFYADPEFICCSHLEKYEFKLFDPTITQVRAKSAAENFHSEQEKLNKIFELLAPKEKETVKKANQKEHQQIIDEELVAAFGMDPSEFNVRFFDENDGEKAHLSQDEKIPVEAEKLDSPSLGEIATEDGEHEDVEENAEDEEDDDELEEEGIRKKNILPENSTDEEEADEQPTQMRKESIGKEHFAKSSRSPSTLPPSSSDGVPSPEPEIGHYLDEYDQHLSRAGPSIERRSSIQSNERERREIGKQYLTNDTKLMQKFKDQYLDHVPHTSSPVNMLPLFPSWAIVCMGHSSVYNHSTGIRGGEGTARFRNGSEFLLPWSVELMVNTQQWVRELQYIGVNPSERTMRNMNQGIQRGRPESKEKVKLFIGFDYECPRGHRFTMGDLGKPLRHRKALGPLKQDASPLLNLDLPIWMLCPCKKEPRASAQLMRIHIVTPKAPVSVRLQPMIQMPEDESGFFFPGGMEGIELGWAKYYVCRLPYAYIGPNGQSSHRPEDPTEFRGRLIRQCIVVNYLSIQSFV